MRNEPLEGLPVADDQVWLQVSAAIYVPLTVACIGWIAWRSGSDVVVTRLLGDQPALWTIAGLAAGGLFAGISQWTTPWMPRMQKMADALATQLGPMAPATTVALAVLSSVGEEWCFRGVLQPGIGWLPATLLFAVVHVPMDRDLWLWPILAFGIGLVLAGMFHYSGGLVGPIALHFTINALNLRWLAHRATEIRRA